MNGLELFKAELMDKLNEKLSIEAVETVMNTIDVISDHFSVTGECRELSTASGRTAKMINYYINARKLEGLAESTLKSYQDSLNYFFGVVKKPVEEITVHDVRGYLYSYNESHEIKKSSLERYRIILSAFFYWCVNEDIIGKNPMASIKPIKFEKPDKGYVSRIDFEYIRNACKDKRDRCIVDMLLSTGCRIGELANIKIKDIDMDQKTIHVYGQKTKEHRDVCIDSVAMVSLRMYLEERNADENDHCEYLFVSKKHPVQRMTTDAYRKMLNRLIGDIPQINRNYTPHNFRHSMATFAIRGGVPIEQVSRMLGHHGTDITLTYAEVSDADVRRSHERCFG